MANILLVDDFEPFRKLAYRILQRAGHRVTEAANGAEALACFQREQPDLVITDLLMPEKAGLEVIQEIKSLKPDIRIIAISGGLKTPGCDYLAIARGLGAHRVLTKPFQRADLLEAVTAVLASGVAPDPPGNGANLHRGSAEG